MDKSVQTAAIVVRFTFDSTVNDPVHMFTGCAGEIKYDDGNHIPFKGWGSVNIGTPVPGGAALVIRVEDTAKAVANVDNWIVAFIPVAPTTDASPIGPNLDSITGNGATPLADGGFQLDIDKQYTIKKRAALGSWDWCVLVQFTMSDGTHRSYASDPEMEVDPLVLPRSEQLKIVAMVAKRQKAAATARRSAPAKKSRRKSRGTRR